MNQPNVRVDLKSVFNQAISESQSADLKMKLDLANQILVDLAEHAVKTNDQYLLDRMYYLNYVTPPQR